MKQVLGLLLFFISLHSWAQIPVIPQVTNLGNSVQVLVYNTNSYPISCTGLVHMQTVNGRSISEFYQAYIIAGGTNFKTFTNWDFSDHIFNVFHTISCIRVN